MVFTTAGGGATDVTDTQIDNSLRFNDDDSAYLSRTPSSASNRKTWTWSGWIKRANINLNMVLFSADNTVGHGIYLDTADKLYLTKSAVGNYGIDAQLRDVSAWYHIVVAVDTTQTGMSNIVKFYINGVQHTASGTTLYSTNDDTNINNNSVHNIGRFSKNSSFYYDGYLSEVNFVDGQQLTPSSFGETNDNGVWIPKYYRGNYGTNGFKLEFKQTGTGADSSGMGADTSGNDHHWTSNNLAATDVTEDTPTNNFATMNPLARINGSGNTPTFSEGNLQLTTSDATSRFGIGSITTTGKYYFEAKITSLSASDSNQRIGIISENSISSSTDYASFYQAGGVITATGESNGSGSSWSVNDIIGVAVDMADSNTVKYYLNGSLQATMSVGASYQSLSTVPATRQLNATNTFQMNFGNPPFSISSGNSDGNGYGNFEYAVPSGYYALCTKNLAEYG